MIGRRVSCYGLTEGVIERWEPYGAAMTDVLVRDVSTDRLCWYASHSLTPCDGLGPLPDRREARKARDEELLESLQKIRDQHVAGFHTERWPGCEFGKAIVGKSLDGAIKSVQERVNRAGKDTP